MINECEMCFTPGPAPAWGPPETELTKALESLGYRSVRYLCARCVTCVVCCERVQHGDGVASNGHLPAIHRRCFQSSAPAALRYYQLLRSALQLAGARSGGDA